MGKWTTARARGGDTIANIFELGFEDEFDFISTGGGAMLEFLTNETLPGIEAIGKDKLAGLVLNNQ